LARCPKCGKPVVRFQWYEVRRGSRVYRYLRAVHYENGKVRFCHIPKRALTSVIYGVNIGIAEAFKRVLMHYVLPPAKVLDVTCGYRIMYEKIFDINKKYNLYDFIFVDVRPEVRPDIVADLRMLPITTVQKFDAIVYDPPYPTHSVPRDNRDYEYGKVLSQRELHELFFELTKAVNNLVVYLKHDGVLIAKVMDWVYKGKLYSAIEVCNSLLTNFELYDIIIYRFFKRSFIRAEPEKRVPRKHSYFLIYRPKK